VLRPPHQNSVDVSALVVPFLESLQLDHSKDVVAQAQAVVGLAGQLTYTKSLCLF
jgi:hypothetical protein